MQTGCHLIVNVLSGFCNGRRQRYRDAWKGTQGSTLCELIREREREYWLWLGGVNGEFKIVIIAALGCRTTGAADGLCMLAACGYPEMVLASPHKPE
jgi:hypothetical protein